jgi:hypothetical protein
MRLSLRAITLASCSRVLRSSLTATVDRDVTLTFSVTNDSASPVTVQFSSGQQYDFIVRSSDTEGLVWRWSDGRAFAQALGSRTLAAGEMVTWTERWAPSRGGTYTAQAVLTSLTHATQQLARFTVQ